MGIFGEAKPVALLVMSDYTYLLVDYDNAFDKREAAPGDARVNLSILTAQLRAAVLRLGMPKDVTVRLYGGWHFEDGRTTPRAEWLNRALPDFRQLKDGVRMKPDLATSVAAAANRVLLGTYRNSNGPEQKMVDTMIVSDAIFLARRKGAHVAVVSDDSDVIPGLVTAGRDAATNSSLTWLRTAARKPHANDPTVMLNCTIEVWT
jgi:hypothetical protein